MDKIKDAAKKLLTVKNLILACSIVCAALVNVLVYWLLADQAGWNAVWASIIAVIAGGAVAALGLMFSGKASALIEKFLTREILLYLIFGGLTTVIDFIIFYVSYNYLHIDEMIATVIAWCGAVAFAYVTNRIWVFESKENTRQGILKEAGMFLSARLLSLGISELIVLFIMKLMGFDGKIGSIVTKIVSSIVVIIFNYFASKLVIFKDKEE